MDRNQAHTINFGVLVRPDQAVAGQAATLTKFYSLCQRAPSLTETQKSWRLNRKKEKKIREREGAGEPLFGDLLAHQSRHWSVLDTTWPKSTTKEAHLSQYSSHKNHIFYDSSWILRNHIKIIFTHSQHFNLFLFYLAQIFYTTKVSLVPLKPSIQLDSIQWHVANFASKYKLEKVNRKMLNW